MPNTIISDQDSPAVIRLFKAQRKAYQEGKFVNTVEWLVKIASLLIPILLILEFDETKKRYAIGIGVALLLIFLVFFIYRRNKKKIGAKIQEQIDVKLFKLPWNTVHCGRTIETEAINSLTKGESEKGLLVWYSSKILSSLTHYKAALLCQYTNVSWGRELRKKYINFLVSTTVVYVVGLIFLAVYKGLTVEQFLYYFIPAFTAFAFTLQQIIAQADLNKSKIKLKNYIEDKIKTASSNDVSKVGNCELSQILRNIQNKIFDQRKSSASVPEWFYNYHKPRMEERADDAVTALIDTYKLLK